MIHLLLSKILFDKPDHFKEHSQAYVDMAQVIPD